MKNKWLLLSIIPLMISGCFTKKDTSGSSSQEPSSSSESSSSEGDERFNMYDFDITNLLETKNLKKCLEDDFIFDEYGYYKGTLESRIEEPSHTANSLQDISDIYDYCAFYKIPSVTITLNYSHVGMKTHSRLHLGMLRIDIHRFHHNNMCYPLSSYPLQHL